MTNHSLVYCFSTDNQYQGQVSALTLIPVPGTFNNEPLRFQCLIFGDSYKKRAKVSGYILDCSVTLSPPSEFASKLQLPFTPARGSPAET